MMEIFRLHQSIRIFCATVMLFVSALVVTADANDTTALNLVGILNSAIKKAMATSGDLRVAALELCDELTRSTFDVEAMMKTASSAAWVKMDSSQREMYHVAFRRRVIRDCAMNAPDYLQTTFELVGVRSLPNGQQIVGTRIRSSQAKILMWQVRQKDGGKLMVTDVMIEGRSAVLSLRDEASLSLERNPGDISALISSLGR